MSRTRVLALALVIAAPGAALAADAPHENLTNCTGCHMGHNASGGGLTNVSGNANLCFSCHQATARYNWSPAEQAIPGVSGQSHSWSAPATGLGATAPASPMGDHLSGGSLVCSTCHETHQADALIGSPADGANLGTQHVSPITKTPSSGAGAVTFAAGSPTPVAAAKNYRIQIVTGGALGTSRFQLSNDKGTSWFGCTAPNTYTYVAYTGTNGCATAASVPLNDGANVTVSFSAATYVAGDRWDFWVTYPFPRVSLKDAAMCTTCHRDRNQTWQNADGTGPLVGTGAAVVFGTTKFSHPVGQALNQSPRTNGLAQILDANGDPQATTADANRSNDLVLGTGGVVTCLTCHHPHRADSNSLTDDTQ